MTGYYLGLFSRSLTTLSMHFLVSRSSLSILLSKRSFRSQSTFSGSSIFDPTKHNASHESLIYELPTSEKELMSIFGVPTPFDKHTTERYKAIQRMPLLIRHSTLAGKDYIERLSPNSPNLRVLFYGDKGHGKTHTLTHLVHYLHAKQEHIIVHVHSVRRFTRSPREFTESTSRPGRIDTSFDAALFLQQFRVQNSNLLDKYKDTLVCSRDYKWSAREVTKAGEPVANVAEHGVNRVIHSSDCAAVLFRELVLAADQGKIKLASVMDEVKYLFSREAGILKNSDNKMILVEEMTVARGLRKLVGGSHKNAVVLAACDDYFSTKQNQTPRETLGIEGWNYFDPCLPIHVPKYSRREFENLMNFYQSIGWLARPESRTQEARDEIRFVSGMNPGEVEYFIRGM